jgi:hypothetical protein
MVFVCAHEQLNESLSGELFYMFKSWVFLYDIHDLLGAYTMTSFRVENHDFTRFELFSVIQYSNDFIVKVGNCTPNIVKGQIEAFNSK